MSIIYLVLNWAKLWCGFHAIIYVKHFLSLLFCLFLIPFFCLSVTSLLILYWYIWFKHLLCTFWVHKLWISYPQVIHHFVFPCLPLLQLLRRQNTQLHCPSPRDNSNQRLPWFFSTFLTILLFSSCHERKYDHMKHHSNRSWGKKAKCEEWQGRLKARASIYWWHHWAITKGLGSLILTIY